MPGANNSASSYHGSDSGSSSSRSSHDTDSSDGDGIPEIADFEFNLEGRGYMDIHSLRPEPSDYLVYTGWYIWRALRQIRRQIRKRTTRVIPRIFKEFEDLEVMRAIQPYQRVKDGEVETIVIPEPKETSQQAAILLYALLPGKEGTKCSSCKSNAGTGPFAECITRGGNWAGGACMNCYFTGARSRCCHKKAHDLAVERAAKEKLQVPSLFPEGVEKSASTVQLEHWRNMIRKEQDLRKQKEAEMEAEMEAQGPEA